jgi:anti-sigma B factor antagonist
MGHEISGGRQRLEVKEVGDVTTIRFTDRKLADLPNVEVIGQQLFTLVDDQRRRNLVLNFAAVEYLSSAALLKLMTLRKKVLAAGGKLVLCGVTPQIYEVFTVSKLDKLFVMRADEQEALKAF